MLFDAYKWRTILRFGRSGATGVWATRSLYVSQDTVLARGLTGNAGLTGWSNWLGQVTGAPSVDYPLAEMILACASISNPTYVPQNWQVWLLTTLIMLIHGCISSMPTKWIANFNSVGSTFNIIALCIVLILIPAATNRESQGLPRFTPANVVWNDFYDGTDFPKGVSILMTFVAVIWTMR